MALAGVCWCVLSQFSCMVNLGNCFMMGRNTLQDTLQQQQQYSVYDEPAPVVIVNVDDKLKNISNTKEGKKMMDRHHGGNNNHRHHYNHTSTISTTKPSAAVTSSYVNRFSVSLDSTLHQRGLNLITPLSGCSLAAWVFQGHPNSTECYFPSLSNKGNIVSLSNNYTTVHVSQELTKNRVNDVRPYDTIYTNIWGLNAFVRTVLPKLKSNNIVLITGRWWYKKNQSMSHKVDIKTETALLKSKRIVKIFTHNMDTYYHNTDHPKFGIWPFGIQNFAYKKNETAPVEIYQEAFWKHYYNATNKTRGVMRGPITKSTNPTARQDIPTGPKLPVAEFYEEVARHKFILSPQGDRPECYRHYEALGLGTIPITDLSIKKQHHLQPGPILYNTTHWYLNETQALRRLGVKTFPEVQRLLVTEEYWMEYVDHQVNGGTKLRWFDRLQSKKATLDEFVQLESTD